MATIRNTFVLIFVVMMYFMRRSAKFSLRPVSQTVYNNQLFTSIRYLETEVIYTRSSHFLENSSMPADIPPFSIFDTYHC